MFARSISLVFLLLAMTRVQAETTEFKDHTRYTGHSYIEFETLKITPAEGKRVGGIWIQLKLDFSGLKINGRSYGANGQAQISLDSHYKTSSPRRDLGIKSAFCEKGKRFLPHYAIDSLMRIVSDNKLKIGNPSLRNYACDLQAYIGSGTPLKPQALMSGVTFYEREFLTYILLNSSIYIKDAVRTSKDMSTLARTSWQEVERDFWYKWLDSSTPSAMAKFSRPFLARVQNATPSTADSAKATGTSKLCVTWQMSTPPRIDVLKAIVVNAGFYDGPIDSKPAGMEFCSALRKFEKKHGDGSGNFSRAESNRILSMPAHKIGDMGWASPKAPVITEIKRNLLAAGLFNGLIDASTTPRLVTSLAKFDAKYGDKNGHLDLREISTLLNNLTSTGSSPVEQEAKFCGVTLGYTASPFDQGLDETAAIQRGLIATGFLNDKADGIAGKNTCSAFTSYISLHGTNGTLNRDQLITLIAKGQSSKDADLATRVTAQEPTSKNTVKANAETTDLQRRLSLLEIKNNTQGDELNRLRTTVKSLETEVSQKEVELNALRGQSRMFSIETMKREAELREAKEELAKSRSQVVKLEKQLEGLRAENTTLNSNSQVLDLTGRIEELKLILSSVSAERDKEKRRADKLLNDTNRLQTSASSQSQEIRKLENEAATLRASLSEISELHTSALKKLEDNTYSLKALTARQSTELEQLRSEVGSFGAERKNLNDKISKLEGLLTEYQSAEAAKTSWMDDLSEDWRKRLDDMPIQQRQFCNIASEFRHDLREATESANQIRINMTFRERQRSLDSLLPDGDFNNWLVRVVTVGQMPDGSARFVAELPCDALIGSGTIGEGPDEKWVATIDYDARAYRELAKVSRGDFIAIQGALLEVERFKPGQPESFYGVNQIGKNPHPEAVKLGLNGEVFIAEVSYLVSLTN